MPIQLIEFITLFATGITAGSAVFISLVTQPVWLKTDVKSAINNFTPTFHSSFLSQLIFSTTAIIGGITLGIISKQYLWLGGSVLMIFNIPFTIFILMPINNILLEKKGALTDSRAIELLLKWGKLQWIRTVVVVIPFLLYIWLSVFK